MWTVRFTGDAVLNKMSICILQPNRDVHCRIIDMTYFATFWARSQNCGKWLVASWCLSVRMEHLSSHRTDFHDIWYLSIFRKNVEKIRVSLKSDKNNKYFTWRPFSILSRSFLLGMRNFSDKSCAENQNTHFMFNLFFFPFFSKIMPFMKWCGEILQSRQTTDDNTALAHCMRNT